MIGHAGHVAFEGLSRPIDVEVAQAHDLRACDWQPATHISIEEQLRVAVYVERSLEYRIVFAESSAHAIDGSGGSIDQRHFLLEAVLEHVDRVAVIDVHHVAPVPFRCYGACALMNYRLGASQATSEEALAEVVSIEVIADPRIP
jgi:hypothetical protein